MTQFLKSNMEQIDEDEEIIETGNVDFSFLNEEDEEFVDAVETLMSFDKSSLCDELPVLKKQRVEVKPFLGEREIVHRILGCRHCKSKFGCEEDVDIHRKIDEIFERMKQTVKST